MGYAAQNTTKITRLIQKLPKENGIATAKPPSKVAGRRPGPKGTKSSSNSIGTIAEVHDDAASLTTAAVGGGSISLVELLPVTEPSDLIATG